jgi:hypothetical protein
MENPPDAYSIYTLAYTYEQWGVFEIVNGFETEGRQYIERARKYYTDLPPSYPYRENFFLLLDRRVDFALKNRLK